MLSLALLILLVSAKSILASGVLTNGSLPL